MRSKYFLSKPNVLSHSGTWGIGAIQVWHDYLALMILIEQDMVCQGGFDAINNFLDTKYPKVIHPVYIGLQPVWHLLSNHALVVGQAPQF